jgi:hypothetical protein
VFGLTVSLVESGCATVILEKARASTKLRFHRVFVKLTMNYEVLNMSVNFFCFSISFLLYGDLLFPVKLISWFDLIEYGLTWQAINLGRMLL